MSLDLDSLFFEDYYGYTWESSDIETRTITWRTEEKTLQLLDGKTINAFPLSNYIQTIRKSFELWDKAIDSIDFAEKTSNNSADIIIAATYIDGIGNTAGFWSYTIEDGKHIGRAVIRLDNDDMSRESTLTIAMHEIGNALGLGDLRVSDAYRSVQEDPLPEHFDGNALWDFDANMINLIYATRAGKTDNSISNNFTYNVILRGDQDTVNVHAIGDESAPDFYVDVWKHGTSSDDSFLGNSSSPVSEFFQGGAGDDELIGRRGGDALSGDSGNDTVRAGNGRDLITGGAGSDEIYGGFGHNTFEGEKDGATDKIFFKSDQFAWNWLYGKTGNNPNGQKVDIIKALDSNDQLFIQGLDTSDLSFRQINEFSAPTGNFSGIGIFASGYLEGIYTGGDLSPFQLQTMTTGLPGYQQPTAVG